MLRKDIGYFSAFIYSIQLDFTKATETRSNVSPSIVLLHVKNGRLPVQSELFVNCARHRASTWNISVDKKRPVEVQLHLRHFKRHGKNFAPSRGFLRGSLEFLRNFSLSVSRAHVSPRRNAIPRGFCAEGGNGKKKRIVRARTLSR